MSNKFKAGSTIEHAGDFYTVLKEFNGILLLTDSNGKVTQVTVNEVNPSDTNIARPDDIHHVSERNWAIALKRFDVISDLVRLENRTKKDVISVAEANDINYVTVYRWLKAYEKQNSLLALVPTKRLGGKGKSRLDNVRLDELIDDVIETHFLTKQRPAVSKSYIELKKRCRKEGLKPPHSNTFRNRIKVIEEEKKLLTRQTKQDAQYRYSPIKGKFPNADFPLSVVQIDHTLIDLILVDETQRLPVGRPWITLAIDVNSRTVPGFYLGFESPNAMSVAMCIANTILPKERWLETLQIETPWPVCGVPQTIHMDNAMEFRSEALKRGCEKYHINVEWRPVAQPHFGGHVERLLGTFAKDIHTLPGTTFSNARERNRYPSEQKAVFTIKEFEQWLTHYIVEVYHQSLHRGILTSPLAKYNEGIYGTESTPGIGKPRTDFLPHEVKLDFMPAFSRTVQRYGIELDNIYYYHDALRHWINAKSPQDPSKKRKFTVKRDPRNISQIYFYDPEACQYIEVPYRDITHPPISIWEQREVVRRLKEQGLRNVDETKIFEGYEALQEIQQKSSRSTKRVRRIQALSEKKSDHNYESKHVPHGEDDELLSEDVKPFEELFFIGNKND